METILGIDLGTTNSEVAVIRDGRVEVLAENEEAILPSVVGLDNGGRILVGTPARNQWILAPDRTVRSIKRKMGDDVTVRLGDRDYAPQEISAIILRTLKERAERQLGHQVRKAVITVPAFFNEIQREATREAGELAGLEVVRIINEPTAASLTYESHPDMMERLLVYDLGGGTFDVSLVQVEQEVVEVLASHGDTHLGGDDFDELLLDRVCDDFKTSEGIDLRESLVARSRLLRAVEEVKKRLSTDAVATLAEEFIAEKDGHPLHLKREISRGEYEELIEPLLAKTLHCVDQALNDAKLNASQIDKVILVGGASRTPLVHRMLQEQLGQPIHSEVNPDLCVAMGAAIQGGLIGGVDVGPVLVDITPHTLGIQALGPLYGAPSIYCYSPIIERNSPLPAGRSEMYSTTIDGQEAAEIAVYQGEDPDVRNNQGIGRFFLEGLADVRRGNEIVVRFELDLDGILKVTAKERTTGLEEQLTIDNAITRFQRDHRAAELRRPGRPPAKPAAVRPRVACEAIAGDGPANLPAGVQQALEQREALIAKAEEIVPKASPEDAAEIRRLVEQLRTATADQSQSEMDSVRTSLEDLVFYLQDV